MFSNPRATLPAGLAVTLAFVLGACDDSTGVGAPGTVALNFTVSSGAGTAAVQPATSGPSLVAGPPMTISGTNGTLTIEEIRLIVAEAELDGDDDACEDDLPGEDCAKFEAPPRFLDLPLDGDPIQAFVGVVPQGTYDELEFEIEDLEDDEDDTQFAAEIAALREDILAEFPDWPRKATALVVGSFEAVGGGTTDFRVYIEAEIEIERALVPPLVVGPDGTTGADITVDIRPDIWFSLSDGSVLDLSDYDYDDTGMVLEFELEMEDGFTELEIDRDD